MSKEKEVRHFMIITIILYSAFIIVLALNFGWFMLLIGAIFFAVCYVMKRVLYMDTSWVVRIFLFIVLTLVLFILFSACTFNIFYEIDKCQQLHGLGGGHCL